MNLLVLGGESLRNKDWAESVAATLQPLFKKVKVHYYAHWQSGEGGINLETEQTALRTEVADLGEDYMVVAKSAGAVLTIKSINDDILKPTKCIFNGLALGMVERGNLPLNDWLKKLKCPTIFIQNIDDPVGGFAKLKNYIQSSGLNNTQFIELPRDTHDYDDFDKLLAMTKEFING